MANFENPFQNLMQGADLQRMMSGMKIPGMDAQALVDVQTRNMEALSDANRKAMEGYQTIARRQGEMVKDAMEAMWKASSELMGQTTPDARLAQGADIMRESFERAVAGSHEIADLLSKVNRDVADTLTERVSKSMDEIKKSMPKTNGT